ncbi:TipAS antibiotic-recognition domain-containing protein [Enteractinococcus fodinae]|uniref:DNA-binding transcriptional MerR regulator n=1 Tax=Enteractinococcus fodinae TaxID=684663 RepID=A0ABU2B4H8_9MICC|nr:MerR family transcriptional regulator [Enteractinococcus fodinae]MDR7347914.1 DNA-binding transcriptional MerR regulator [Enteractinococcus fodinae]
MEWSIHQVVEATGITSRTLRHYDQIGLLHPTRRGPGGLRYYDQRALVRLQRILLLRPLGLSLADIAEILNGETRDIEALQTHRARLQAEQERIDRQLQSLDATIAALQKGQPIMPKDMFEGFDHTQYDAEVRERWGNDAADRSNEWWSELGDEGQAAFRQEVEDLNAAWDQVIASGIAPDAAAAQEVAARHVAWLRSAMQSQPMSKAMLKGITQMYVDDERFAANYNRVSPAGPQFVRDAVHYWADDHLPADQE